MHLTVDGKQTGGWVGAGSKANISPSTCKQCPAASRSVLSPQEPKPFTKHKHSQGKHHTQTVKFHFCQSHDAQFI